MAVLENINLHDGSGNTLTSTSNALDVNLKTSAATVTVAQPTAADLNATVRNQDGAGNNLSSTGGALDSNLKTIGGTAPSTGTGASGAGIPRVTVANDLKVQPWDGTNSAKFDATGETTTDITRFGGAPVSLGQTNMAHSIPVAFASDQQLAVSGVYNNQTGTTNSGTVPNSLNGVLNIVNDVFVWSSLVLNFVAPPSNSTSALSLGGTFQVEGSIDGNTWTALTGTLLSDTPEQITEFTTTGLLTCSARYNLAGFPWVRLRTTQPFTGTINVQQCLTTAQGDEVGFTTARIVDDSGNSVDLTPAAQYTEGQSPQAIYFQGGQTTLPTFPETTQIAQPAEAVYVLPKRSQIGNTLVIAVVIQGTGLTAANLAPMWLVDTAGASYTLAQLYDNTVTSAGQAIALYVRAITAVDNEGQIGLMLGFNGLVSGGSIVVTGINILAHEYSGVVVPGDSFAHVMTAANTSGLISAPTAPIAGYLVYSLISSQTNEFLSFPSANRLTSGPYLGSTPYPVENATGDNITQLEGLNTAWDWVCVKLPIVATGQVLMGRLTGGGDGQIQAIKIDSASGGILAAVTNDSSSPLSVSVVGGVEITTAEAFPVQLQDGSAHPISSTGGSLNVNMTNGPLPVTQSGTWSVTAINGSVDVIGGASNGLATMAGAFNPSGTVEGLHVDANNNLNVNVAAGSISPNPAASTTGSAVPADASYTAFNSSGNLVGVSTTNPLPVTAAIPGTLNVVVTNPTTQTNPAASPAGNTVPSYASYTGFNQGNDLVGVSATNPMPVTVVAGGVSNVSIQSGSTALTNTSGALDVNIKSGTASNPAASATGSTVPAAASYTGFSSGGTLVGVSASTPLPVSVNGLADVAGFVTASAPTPTANTFSALSLTSAGALRVDASGPELWTNIHDGAGNSLTSTSGALNINVAGSTSSISCLASLAVDGVPGEPNRVTDGVTSVPVSANISPQTATNPMFARATDGTKAITSAVSALGTAPSGAEVMAVNSVQLASTAIGAALSAKFINNSGAAVSIKNSAGNLYGFSLTNSTASPVFVEFFNTASAPTLGTTAVVFCVVIPSSGNVTINPTALGLMNFFLGIGFAVTTAENGTTTAAVTGMLFFA